MVEFLPLKLINKRYESEIQGAIKRVLDSGWYILGKEVREFESSYANYIGTKYCVGCGNGYDALSLMLRAYKELGVLKEGDEVIVPANTYIATILVITENDLIPMLAEPSSDTLLLDTEILEKYITPKTKAILTVHLYGRLAFSEHLKELCIKNNLLLLEDNAQAHGCTWNGKRTGSLGNAAAHSFYPGKNLGALGDGGAITTDDEQLAMVLRALVNYGSSKKYTFDYQGRNSRLDEIQAAILNVKLHHLDEDNKRRKEIADYYYNKLVNPLIRLPQHTNDNVYHLFPVLCSERDKLKAWLEGNDIQTLIHYPIPPHHQKCYEAFNHFSLPVTEMISKEELSLPINQVMTYDEMKNVVEMVNSFRL